MIWIFWHGVGWGLGESYTMKMLMTMTMMNMSINIDPDFYFHWKVPVGGFFTITAANRVTTSSTAGANYNLIIKLYKKKRNQFTQPLIDWQTPVPTRERRVGSSSSIWFFPQRASPIRDFSSRKMLPWRNSIGENKLGDDVWRCSIFPIQERFSFLNMWMRWRK